MKPVHTAGAQGGILAATCIRSSSLAARLNCRRRFSTSLRQQLERARLWKALKTRGPGGLPQHLWTKVCTRWGVASASQGYTEGKVSLDMGLKDSAGTRGFPTKRTSQGVGGEGGSASGLGNKKQCESKRHGVSAAVREHLGRISGSKWDGLVQTRGSSRLTREGRICPFNSSAQRNERGASKPEENPKK